MQSDLYLFFEQYKHAAESALERGEEFNEIISGSAFVMVEIFHRAVALYPMAWKTKSFKYSEPENRIRKKIEKKSGNPNMEHCDHFLQAAEYTTMKGRYKEAKGHYGFEDWSLAPH